MNRQKSGTASAPRGQVSIATTRPDARDDLGHGTELRVLRGQRVEPGGDLAPRDLVEAIGPRPRVQPHPASVANGPRGTSPRAVTSTAYRMHNSEHAFADDQPVCDGGVPGGTFAGT